MSRGYYLSLEEARESNKIDQFASEHPSTADQKRFDDLLDVMVRTPEVGDLPEIH